MNRAFSECHCAFVHDRISKRNQGLHIERILNTIMRAHAETRVVLEGDTDEIGNGILYLLGELAVALTGLALLRPCGRIGHASRKPMAV